MTGLQGNAPLQYLSVEFWKDGKWHGASYRHKPLPGGSDIPRYILHVTTDEGFDDPRDAAAKINAAFPNLPNPLAEMSDEDIQRGIKEAKEAFEKASKA